MAEPEKCEACEALKALWDVPGLTAPKCEDCGALETAPKNTDYQDLCEVVNLLEEVEMWPCEHYFVHALREGVVRVLDANTSEVISQHDNRAAALIACIRHEKALDSGSE